MRMLFLVCLACCVSMATGCSTVYDIQYDYDQNIDFSRLQAYDWLPTPQGAHIDDINIARVKKAVNAVLNTKGFRLSPQEPDFLIAEHMGAEEKVEINNWGYAYGPYNGYWGGYWSNGGVSEYRYEEGTLILDFVDAGTQKLIWRGAAKAEIDMVNTPEKKDRLVAEAVEKILEHFPPKNEQ